MATATTVDHWDGFYARLPATDDPRDLEREPITSAEVEGWSALRAAGWPSADVADQAGVPPAMVRSLCRESTRAEAEGRARTRKAEHGEVREPRVVLALPPGPLTPRTRCPHDLRPIPRGEPTVCLICHRSGLDGIHAALARNPKTDPRPEPRPPKPKPAKPQTRAERRKALAELAEEQRRDDERSARDARRFKQAKALAERDDARRGR